MGEYIKNKWEEIIKCKWFQLHRIKASVQMMFVIRTNYKSANQ